MEGSYLGEVIEITRTTSREASASKTMRLKEKKIEIERIFLVENIFLGSKFFWVGYMVRFD